MVANMQKKLLLKKWRYFTFNKHLYCWYLLVYIVIKWIRNALSNV